MNWDRRESGLIVPQHQALCNRSKQRGFFTMGPGFVGQQTYGPIVPVAWWPLHAAPSLSFSPDYLTATNNVTFWHACIATVLHDGATANHYFELKLVSGIYLSAGVQAISDPSDHEIGYGVNAYGYLYDGSKEHVNNVFSYGAGYTTGDIIGICLKNGNIYFSKNGAWQGGGNPIAETGYAFSGITGDIYPGAALYDTPASFTGRFKLADFNYAPPSGSSSWEGD